MINYRMGFFGTLVGLLLFLCSACGLHNANSFSNDIQNYEPRNIEGSESFRAVNAIVSKNCGECHAYGGYSEKDWVKRHYVVPGNPTDSVLLQRLYGSDVPGPQDMPKTGGLSPDEIQTIRDWVTQMPKS